MIKQSLSLSIKHLLNEIPAPLVDNQVGTIHYQPPQQHDPHPLLVALLAPEFVGDHRSDCHPLPALHVGLHGVQGVGPNAVNQPRQEGRKHLAAESGIYSVFFLEKVHHADMEPTVVDAQPRSLFDHCVLQTSINLSEPGQLVLSDNIVNPHGRALLLCPPLVNLSPYLGKLNWRIDHRAGNPSHESRTEQFYLFGNLEGTQCLVGGLEDGKLQSSGQTREEVHGGGS